ncbi:transporter substrate-binding domain-containing protein [Methylobacterium nonmethylotrophicum]|uniref:Transporter substrate-binding domain-containing protein n=1 Tax=Methylobacterium nonmethylotrophicum TaxID=1141884 RepID=A0A4Z0NQV3_9HYPH|nr:transporter substrate-binding domain-containing protein [Methylobacterium nonmethylotrophicum]TGD99101.1 transporter substrate-binding domain-containing protein [Methylobacterium nonmethylotrophicum]
MPQGQLRGLLAALWVLAAFPASAAEAVTIPNFWNPRARLERPEPPQTTRPVRFLTDDEYPPLHFAGPDGNPTGFSVELARAACEKLGLTCTVQVRRFDTLLDALQANQGDVVAAAIPLTATLRADNRATRPYFRWPARFAVRGDKSLPAPDVKVLAEHPTGVVSGTAHEAYLRTFFRVTPKTYPDLATAEAALRRGEIEYLFGDGLALALWIGGTDAGGCCAFAGGDYLENRYFGEGIGFVTRKEDQVLARALDDALQRLWDEGKYAELYLRFFPVSPF